MSLLARRPTSGRRINGGGRQVSAREVIGVTGVGVV